MIGITLTTDQIRNAPPQVRQWIEHEVIAALGISAETPATQPSQTGTHLVSCSAEEVAAMLEKIRGIMPALNVFFEFGRPGVAFGQPAVMAFRLIDILHHARLQNIEQVMVCLEAINQAVTQIRHDPSARFCGFDNEGHCFVTQETQRNVAALWQSVLANQQVVPGGEALRSLAPAA
jgi:hypothetical protein